MTTTTPEPGTLRLERLHRLTDEHSNDATGFFLGALAELVADDDWDAALHTARLCADDIAGRKIPVDTPEQRPNDQINGDFPSAVRSVDVDGTVFASPEPGRVDDFWSAMDERGLTVDLDAEPHWLGEPSEDQYDLAGLVAYPVVAAVPA